MIRDTMDTWYALEENDAPRVARGETVAAGDVIATGPGSPAILAYAATLRLSVEASADAIARYDGAACTAGMSLGARRVGLKTRSVSAPVGGIARGLPHSGALVIRDQAAARERRARYGGTVRALNERAIVVASEVARCGYAFADEDGDLCSLHIEPALLDAAPADADLPPLPHPASIVVAHIADAARLASALRSFSGTLIVGSVAESAAWTLMERARSSASRRGTGPGIVALDGIGDAQAGARAVASFRHFHGARAILDRFTQTLTIIPPGDTPPEAIAEGFSGRGAPVERRDPANYGMPCDAQGTPYVALVGGVRALCVGPSDGIPGAPHIPVQNLRHFDTPEGSYVR